MGDVVTIKGKKNPDKSALTIARGAGSNRGSNITCVNGALTKLPKVPADLDPDEQEHWKAIASQLVSDGLLVQVDLPHVVSLAIRQAALAKVEKEAKKCPFLYETSKGMITHPMRSLLDTELKAVSRLRNELGIGSANRASAAIKILQESRLRGQGDLFDGDFEHVGNF